MTEPPDIVSVLLALFAGFFATQDMAQAIVPYMAIILAALAGAGISLSHGGGEKMPMLAGLWYVGVRVLLAVTITIWLADWLNSFVPTMQPRKTMVPIALLIGCVRDWESVRRFIFRLLRREVESKVPPNE